MRHALYSGAPDLIRDFNQLTHDNSQLTPPSLSPSLSTFAISLILNTRVHDTAHSSLSLSTFSIQSPSQLLRFSHRSISFRRSFTFLRSISYRRSFTFLRSISYCRSISFRSKLYGDSGNHRRSYPRSAIHVRSPNLFLCASFLFN